MPVPASINDLSTTPGSNSPPGSESPATIDDYLRTHAAFIAQLRDGKLASSAVSAYMLTVLNDVDAATARATLGVTKQGSVTDTTAGSLLIYGAFGLGSAILLTDLNTTHNGFFFASSGATNSPDTTVGVLLGLTIGGAGTGTRAQWAHHSSTGKIHRRNYNGTTWSSWGAVFDSQTGGSVVNDAARLGFADGSGGSVTQVTSKSTAVTLNKPAGRVITHNAALAAGASVAFTLNNSKIADTDVLIPTAVLNSNYRVECASIFTGVASIRITNLTGGSLSEAITINFVVISGANT